MAKSINSKTWSLLVSSGGRRYSEPLNVPPTAPVIYSDDLESGVDGAAIGGRGIFTASTNTTISAGQAYRGTKSLRFSYVGTPNGDASAEGRFDLGAVYSDLTLRFRWYVPANFVHRDDAPNPNNNKFLRLWGDDYANLEKVGASFWRGSSDSDSSLIADWDTGTGIGSKGQTAANFITADDFGKWMNIIIYVKTESSEGAADGVFKVWKNNALVLNNTTMNNYNAGEPHGFQYGYLMGWANSGYADTTYFYIDNLAIYDGDAT